MHRRHLHQRREGRIVEPLELSEGEGSAVELHPDAPSIKSEVHAASPPQHRDLHQQKRIEARLGELALG